MTNVCRGSDQMGSDFTHMRSAVADHPARPQSTKTLILHIEVPDFWADELDEYAGYCSEPDPPGPKDRLYVVTAIDARRGRSAMTVSVLGAPPDSQETPER